MPFKALKKLLTCLEPQEPEQKPASELSDEERLNIIKGNAPIIVPRRAQGVEQYRALRNVFPCEKENSEPCSSAWESLQEAFRAGNMHIKEVSSTSGHGVIMGSDEAASLLRAGAKQPGGIQLSIDRSFVLEKAFVTTVTFQVGALAVQAEDATPVVILACAMIHEDLKAYSQLVKYLSNLLQGSHPTHIFVGGEFNEMMTASKPKLCPEMEASLLRALRTSFPKSHLVKSMSLLYKQALDWLAIEDYNDRRNEDLVQDLFVDAQAASTMLDVEAVDCKFIDITYEHLELDSAYDGHIIEYLNHCLLPGFKQYASFRQHLLQHGRISSRRELAAFDVTGLLRDIVDEEPCIKMCVYGDVLMMAAVLESRFRVQESDIILPLLNVNGELQGA